MDADHHEAGDALARRLRQVQAYAGWHVTDVDGRTVGVLGAMDVVPRAWTSGELLALMDLAHECAPVVRAVAEAARAEDRERTAAASG